MGNSRSNFQQTASMARSQVPSVLAEKDDSGEFLDDDKALDSRLRAQYEQQQKKRDDLTRTRRRSVSVHVRSIRRQSSMVYENLVKINLFRNVRDVYAGLDSAENQIGEGTWGSVRLVTRRDDPSKKAAIKILQLNDALDDNRLNELRSEINLLQKIDHPHIAKLYETYEDDGLNLYLVMEFLSGGELFDRVINQGHFSEFKAAQAVKQMVGAIQYLHGRGIVHRDLKLENFMYRSKDSDNLVLIDFGLSCRYVPDDKDKKMKYMREMVGSSYYMAPEVMKRKYGQECDMWSIGVIAYMLLSGHPPFAGDTDAQIMRKVRKGVYHFEHSAFQKVSHIAKDFVKKLLVYEPKDRMSAKDALSHPWLSEHHKTMMQRNSQRRQSVMGKEVVENLKNFVNTNRFKKLALQAVAYSTSYDDIKELQQMFEDIDQDQDGYISMEELQAALKDNPYVDSTYISKIFEAMDIDKLQKIHLNDFIAATMNHSILKDETLLMEAFNRLDVSETGEISREDLADILGKNFDKNQIDMIFREFSQEIRKSKSENVKGEKYKTMNKVTKKDFFKAMRRARINNTASLISLPADAEDVSSSEKDSDSDEESPPI